MDFLPCCLFFVALGSLQCILSFLCNTRFSYLCLSFYSFGILDTVTLLRTGPSCTLYIGLISDPSVRLITMHQILRAVSSAKMRITGARALHKGTPWYLPPMVCLVTCHLIRRIAGCAAVNLHATIHDPSAATRLVCRAAGEIFCRPCPVAGIRCGVPF